MATSKSTDGPPVQHFVHHEAPPALEVILEKHGKKLAIFLLLGVVAVCVAFVMRALHAEKVVEASQAFTDAETIADFEKVAEERKGTAAGGSALLMLAARHQTYGKYDEARIALLQFTKEYKKHPRYFQGLFDLGLISEQLGQNDEASKYFSEVAASQSELAPLALLRQAEDTAAKGDLKAAKEVMQGIARAHPSNAFIEHIDTRIEALDRRITLAENPPPAPEPEPEAPVTPEAPPVSLLPTPGAPNVESLAPVETAPETTAPLGGDLEVPEGNEASAAAPAPGDATTEPSSLTEETETPSAPEPSDATDAPGLPE
jgi:tetratricopeptide (TPR) repeat protein